MNKDQHQALDQLVEWCNAPERTHIQLVEVTCACVLLEIHLMPEGAIPRESIVDIIRQTLLFYKASVEDGLLDFLLDKVSTKQLLPETIIPFLTEISKHISKKELKHSKRLMVLAEILLNRKAAQ